MQRKVERPKRLVGFFNKVAAEPDEKKLDYSTKIEENSEPEIKIENPIVEAMKKESESDNVRVACEIRCTIM